MVPILESTDTRALRRLLDRTPDDHARLEPAVREILAAVRSAARDSHHEFDDEWNGTVASVADELERAIGDTLGDRTLADLVAADARSAVAPS